MYISIDPGATNITGYFCFWTWNKWKFHSFQDIEWEKHIDFLNKLIEDYKPELIIYENSNYLKRAVVNKHFRNLLKSVAGIELTCFQKSIAKQEISNITVEIIEKNWGKTNKLPGLVFLNKKWYFKDKELNDHEKDALICFYLYWNRILKRDWPFSN